MLRNVVESYIDTLSEREFDTPLMCLLFRNNFFDIHFLHGNFEFGKDFIAKKIENGETMQYVFQSKAGDINQKDWRDLRSQIDDMRINYLAHPNYGRSLKLVVVAVITGRLKGGANLNAQQYNDYCVSRGEAGFIIWDRENLVEMVLQTGESIFHANNGADFLRIIGTLRTGKGNFNELEKYSRNWLNLTVPKLSYKDSLDIIIESLLICHELHQKNRITLACYVTLMNLRAIMFLIHRENSIPVWASQILNIIKNNFMYFANFLKDSIGTNDHFPKLDQMQKDFSSFITYPVLCQQTIEILGLFALLECSNGNIDNAKHITEILKLIIENNAGCTNLISDKYAVSLIAPMISLYVFNYSDTCHDVLINTTKWLCDRYENSEFGLASSESDEKEEIERLIGYAYDFIQLTSRRESLIATVLLDLTIIFKKIEFYSDITNDIFACKIYPCLIHMDNTLEQYRKDGNLRYNPNIVYEENYASFESNLPLHYKDPIGFFATNGYKWESIALYSVLRDRYRISEISNIIGITSDAITEFSNR